MTVRPGPRDLRASDADRDLVLALLGDAAADGRLTLEEHAERAGHAHAARTLGDLAGLTADLAVPSEQPFQLGGTRIVAAICGRERRQGRWVVPERFPVLAVFGDVVLDLRHAVMQSQHVVIAATAIAGQIRLIVPEGMAVHMDGRVVLGVRSVRGRRTLAAAPGSGIIEIRTRAVAGRVTVAAPRRSRWLRSRIGGRPAVTGRR